MSLVSPTPKMNADDILSEEEAEIGGDTVQHTGRKHCNRPTIITTSTYTTAHSMLRCARISQDVDVVYHPVRCGLTHTRDRKTRGCLGVLN